MRAGRNGRVATAVMYHAWALDPLEHVQHCSSCKHVAGRVGTSRSPSSRAADHPSTSQATPLSHNTLSAKSIPPGSH